MWLHAYLFISISHRISITSWNVHQYYHFYFFVVKGNGLNIFRSSVILGRGFKHFSFFFTPIWGRFPFWLIFFRWVETTNQHSFENLHVWSCLTWHPWCSAKAFWLLGFAVVYMATVQQEAEQGADFGWWKLWAGFGQSLVGNGLCLDRNCDLTSFYCLYLWWKQGKVREACSCWCNHIRQDCIKNGWWIVRTYTVMKWPRLLRNMWIVGPWPRFDPFVFFGWCVQWLIHLWDALSLTMGAGDSWLILVLRKIIPEMIAMPPTLWLQRKLISL